MKFLVVLFGLIYLTLANTAQIQSFVPIVNLDKFADILQDASEVEVAVVAGEQNALEIEDDSDEPLDNVSDHPGLSYADTPEKLSAIGIDTRFVDPSIIEDSFLLVVSILIVFTTNLN